MNEGTRMDHMDSMARYSRQIAYSNIGVAGQERLAASRIAVVGIGALGTVIANSLARAGVGHLRLIDRDYVEESNLQRQCLFTEEDARAGLPKAEAAALRLGAVNSGITIEPVVIDLDAGNAERLLSDVDVVVDGSDNFELRYLVNDVCLKLDRPWVYGGALMDAGVTMNILPGAGPCLRCLLPEPPSAGSQQTCASAGVLNMITGVIGNIEAAEAMKLALRSPQVRTTFLSINLWNSSFREVELARDPECPACAHGRYDFLSRARESRAVSLCGRDSIQISPADGTVVDFSVVSERLRHLGTVRSSDFMLIFSGGDREIRLFKDGRAIISKVRDATQAKSIYSEYIGL